MPIKPLNVVWFLYYENSWLLPTREEGFWVNISVRSMMTRTLGNFSFITDGMNLSMDAQDGHMFMDPSTI